MASEQASSRGDGSTQAIPRLCYVEPPWAWFATAEPSEVRSDDWDDAPYRCNASHPYESEEYELVKVAYDGPLYVPSEGPRPEADGIESTSVDRILSEPIPWLAETNYHSMFGEMGVQIPPGATVGDFRSLVDEAGGEVYEP